jgi:hypothetical protein
VRRVREDCGEKVLRSAWEEGGPLWDVEDFCTVSGYALGQCVSYTIGNCQGDGPYSEAFLRFRRFRSSVTSLYRTVFLDTYLPCNRISPSW